MADVVVPLHSSSRRRKYAVLLYIAGLVAAATMSYSTVSLHLLKDSFFGELQQSLGLASSFSFTTFPAVDEMLVDQRLIEIATHRPKDFVVIFVDTTYLETFGVWLDHYKQHNNSNRILAIFAVSKMAFDMVNAAFSLPTTQAKLRHIGEVILVNLYPGTDVRDTDHFLNKLWILRLHIMRQIITTFPTLNVLYTDADAIWLKDPAQLYNHPQHVSSSIVASRGSFPENCPLAKELHDDQKMHLNTVTICLGFTYFRNSPDLRQLAQNLENAVARYSNDDQAVINCVLSLQYGSHDNIHLDDPSSMTAFTQPDKSIIRSFFGKVIAHNIKVSILPYEHVTRRCGRDEGMLANAVVAHCYTSQKEGKSKLDAFRHFGFLVEGEKSLRHVFDHPELKTVEQLASSSARVTGTSWEEAAYSLSIDRFWRHMKAVNPEGVIIEKSYYPNLKAQYQSTIGQKRRSTSLLNSVRIPKAGSSALSVTARALAGCQPDGYPCCKSPGDPVGSCPRKDLMCPLVTGCAGHRPDYHGDEPVITTLRNPVSRSVSAFFYHYPHTSVKHGEPHTWEKFTEDIQRPRYRNILTKMLNGAYAYDDFDESKHTVSRAKTRLCSIAWFGLSEMPVSSSMMLYETPQFRKLLPNPVTFGLPASGATEENVVEGTDGLRVNSDSEYKEFLATSFATNDGSSFVMKHNQYDIEVFQFAEKLFCERLLANVLLVEEIKQVGLGSEEIEKCTSFGNIEKLCYNTQNNVQQ